MWIYEETFEIQFQSWKKSSYSEETIFQLSCSFAVWKEKKANRVICSLHMICASADLAHFVWCKLWILTVLLIGCWSFFDPERVTLLTYFSSFYEACHDFNPLMICSKYKKTFYYFYEFLRALVGHKLTKALFKKIGVSSNFYIDFWKFPDKFTKWKVCFQMSLSASILD